MISNPSNSLEWMVFLAQKYSSMFIKGTWLTLYISVVGTLLGFVLGYIVGIVNDVKLNDGAWAMGMSPFKTMLYVVLPQAFKNIIPEMANTFLLNLKMTSVLNVIAVQELFMAAKTVGGNYYKYFESYLVIAVIYFVLCFVFDKLFKLIEKKLQGKTDYALAVEYMDNE